MTDWKFFDQISGITSYILYRIFGHIFFDSSIIYWISVFEKLISSGLVDIPLDTFITPFHYPLLLLSLSSVHSKTSMFSIGGIQNLNIVNYSLYSFFVSPHLILLNFLKVVRKCPYFTELSARAWRGSALPCWFL